MRTSQTVDSGKSGKDTPVPDLVGTSQCAFGHLAANTHSVQFAGLGTEAGNSISQIFSIGKLSESHNPKLFQVNELLNAEITFITRNTTMDSFQRHDIHDLGKDHLAFVYNRSPEFQGTMPDFRRR
jgi:hypothetical protein